MRNLDQLHWAGIAQYTDELILFRRLIFPGLSKKFCKDAAASPVIDTSVSVSPVSSEKN